MAARPPSRLAIGNEQLLKRARAALNRDLRHIDKEAATGKLSPESSRALTNYLKVLTELAELSTKQKEKSEKEIAALSTEELEAKLKEALNGNKG